ncbi:hypothetical protein LWI28_016790 [Acer negundo]|uniref:Uncharacterized protein n=1 Tax=Acer negundo TaxID=4023 RepID=A0AAD5J0N3_ACENE|nr:hypothetical protein LWI28_016790 [Acer negundo]KAK4847285.1 hypothetical protein QYF36_000337 [Acer negundo]
MKRGVPWNDEDSDSSSSSDSDAQADKDVGKPNKITSQVNSRRKKSGALDFEALKRYGYKGGLSVLNVPLPKEDVQPDWTWSTGREHREGKESEKSSEEQQKPGAVVMDKTWKDQEKEKEKKNVSFSQKEKRKRELGQASRAKNYVEEEKRLLRDSGVYSGFDA